MNKFKKGDRVRCIDALGCHDLEYGKIYTVLCTERGNDCIGITKNEPQWWSTRFELVKEITNWREELQ